MKQKIAAIAYTDRDSAAIIIAVAAALLTVIIWSGVGRYYLSRAQAQTLPAPQERV